MQYCEGPACAATATPPSLRLLRRASCASQVRVKPGLREQCLQRAGSTRATKMASAEGPDVAAYRLPKI